MADLYIYVKDQDSQPIEGVTVRLADSANQTVLAQALTNQDGVAHFSPDPGSYVIRLWKVGVFFDGLLGDSNKAVQAVTVSKPSSSYDVVGRIPALPESQDPYMCRVSFDVVDLSFLAIDDYRLVISVDNDSGRVIHGRLVGFEDKVVEVRDGHAEIDLVRGWNYQAMIGRARVYLFPFVVPQAPSARLVDLILPYAKTVNVSDDLVIIDKDATFDVEVTVTLTDGQQGTAASYITASVADESIVEIILEGDVLTIRGLDRGTTEISFDHADTYRVPIPPTSGWPTITVTVQ